MQARGLKHVELNTSIYLRSPNSKRVESWSKKSLLLSLWETLGEGIFLSRLTFNRDFFYFMGKNNLS